MGKKMKGRISKILEILSNENKIEVAALSEALGVSQVTARKDLDELERKGIIIREHGFAILNSSDDINGRIAYHYDEKKKIAEKAAELVSNGSTIIIENGSCCALLAETIAESKKDVTIITNSAFIADYIRKNSNTQIILIGGIYQRDSQVLVGPMVKQCAENFCVDLFFIGADGYSDKNGFTNRDQMRAQAVRDMASQANKVIVLTESEKFSKQGVLPIGLGEKIKTVITDNNIDENMLSKLKNDGVNVICVDTD